MKLDKPLTNCVNCGGVLKDGVCPFCDSDYRNINADSENGYVNVVHILTDTDKLIAVIKSAAGNLEVSDTCAAHIAKKCTMKNIPPP